MREEKGGHRFLNAAPGEDAYLIANYFNAPKNWGLYFFQINYS
jgi:hypothetical protein